MGENSYYNYQRQEIAAYIPKSIKTILDIGCGEGRFLQLIKKYTGAETWGIESQTKCAEIAKSSIDKMICGKVEDVLKYIPEVYFDCITFNDVLEHLYDPYEILRLARNKLNPLGIIVASIPNVRFFDNLYELIIKGDWKYKEAGILDYTHLRFFTKKSILRLFNEAGYMVVHHEGINEKNTIKFYLFNLITFGIFKDTKYRQFLCVAKAK